MKNDTCPRAGPRKERKKLRPEAQDPSRLVACGVEKLGGAKKVGKGKESNSRTYRRYDKGKRLRENRLGNCPYVSSRAKESKGKKRLDPGKGGRRNGDVLRALAEGGAGVQ